MTMLVLLGLSPGCVIAKNIILIIGDGMGVPYLSALRYYQAATDSGNSNTIFDSMGVGMISTYPEGKFKVTDSAAGGTALATGHKTENGRIAMTANMQPLQSVLKIAKVKGLKTGVVVTSSVTDATPASFLTNNPDRRNQNEIAYSYIQQAEKNQALFDIILGGGRDYFEKNPLIENVLKKHENFRYVKNFDRLNKNDVRPEIGVFADNGLPFAIDKRNPNLSEMTSYSLQKLENLHGFFLLIESSQIDWCGHMNDIVCAVEEMKDFAKTAEVVKQFVNKHPDSLMVITADHSTGGLTIGSGRGKYWNPSLIDKIHASGDKISKELISSDDEIKTWQKYSDVPLNRQQWIVVKKYIKQGDQVGLRRYLNHLVNLTTNTGWTTESHTGEDVPVFAYGEHAAMFHGFYDNTEIANRLKKILISEK